MALTYPVKIEFKEYPSGSWADWSQYLAEAPIISKRVESENEGEAGVIVFDSADVTFRYDNGTPVYTAFSGDLSAKQRYLFRISAPKQDKSYVQLYEGMADFSTIHWPDPDEGKLIAFSIIDKLSALGMLPAEIGRVEDTLNARVLAQAPAADELSYWPQSGGQTIYLRAQQFGVGGYDLNNPIVFPGEILSVPIDFTVDYSMEEHVVIKVEIEIFNGVNCNKVTVAPGIVTTNNTAINLASDLARFYEKELYGVDINHVVTGELQYLKGTEIILALYNQAWPSTTLVKKPSSLALNVPSAYAIRMIAEDPLGGTPLDALKTLADTLKSYIYVNKAGDLVVQSKADLSTNGTTRSIGTTKVIRKPEKKYFWDKLVDGVTVEIKSWITDEFGEYLVGNAIKTKQIPGSSAFIKPKNEITKELLTSVDTEDTQAELDARAATEAQNYIDFYGKRRSSFDLELALDDNTINWELVDNIELDTLDSFFTSLEYDLAERVITLEPVEIAGHDYDFRQIVVGLSEANSIGAGVGGTTVIIQGGGTGTGTYTFSSPLLNTGGTVSLQMTGNFKITGSSLDTIQNILPTSTPTFNQLNLSSPGTSGQAVRADRSVLTSVPLTGGGDLTANRTIQINYADPLGVTSNNLTVKFNTTNLRLTTAQLNTIQDIHSTANPNFNDLTLAGLLTVNGAGNNYIAGNLGIGVTPTVKLQVAGDGYFSGKLGLGVTPVSTATLQVNGNIFVSGGDRIIQNYSNNYLAFGTNNTERIRILGTGNIGINIPLPNVALEVGGNVHVSGGDRTFFNRSNNYLAFGTNNQEAFRIKNDLNVGFGVTNPVEKINLSGHFRQDGSWSLYNNFTSGWIGSGWRIDYNISSASESTLEADNLFLRGSLTVYELIINQIRASRGTVYITPANGKIASVTGTPPNEVVTIEDPEGNGYTSFSVNDIIIMQKVDLDNITVIKRIVRRVASTGDPSTVITLASLLGAPADIGSLTSGDDLISIGNTVNTSRQGSLYLTSDDSNAPFMDVIDNVDSWAAWRNPAKLKVRLGKLTGITDPVFGSLSDYGLYATRLYLSSKSTSNGIALFADSATSRLTMYQGGNIIFNFDTATATAKIAGWTIDNEKLYNASLIKLDATNRVISVFNDAVKMYYTSAGDYGLKDSAGRFSLGSTNQIAGWFFDTGKLYNGTDVVLDATNKRISVYNNAVRIFFTSIEDYGIKDAAGMFSLGAINEIAGWVFDTNKFTKGSSAAGFSLNTSSTPFITGNNSKGFEIYDTTNIKLFAGLRDSSGKLLRGFDWNISEPNELTVKGKISASSFSSKASIGSLESGIDITGFSFIADRYNLGGNDYRANLNGVALVMSNLSGSQEFIRVEATINSARIEIEGKNVGKYHGELSSAPTVNLRSGDTYWDTTLGRLYMRALTSWIQIS